MPDEGPEAADAAHHRQRERRVEHGDPVGDEDPGEHHPDRDRRVPSARRAVEHHEDDEQGHLGAEVVGGPEGADPASVAFDAVDKGIEAGADVVVIDTAGRLHTKTGLMDELGKVKRVIEKRTSVDEVLLVLDATTGQNGLRQARVFAEVVDVSGIVLTKLDGTAKGGIVIAVQRELEVPVKLVGLGEGPDDLAPFDAETFVDAILGD